MMFDALCVFVIVCVRFLPPPLFAVEVGSRWRFRDVFLERVFGVLGCCWDSKTLSATRLVLVGPASTGV